MKNNAPAAPMERVALGGLRLLTNIVKEGEMKCMGVWAVATVLIAGMAGARADDPARRRPRDRLFDPALTALPEAKDDSRKAPEECEAKKEDDEAKKKEDPRAALPVGPLLHRLG